MPTVVGVRLRFSKTLWFDPNGLEPLPGDLVIVSTDRGEDVGTVIHGNHEVATEDLSAPLKPVLRFPTEEDVSRLREMAEKEAEALPVFRELIERHRLDMKPVGVEYLMSGDRIIFYFSAEERVDFRDLVRELASRFQARIDMRQIGVRDEARAVGGIGHCGQMLCCVRFGGEFQPVSIRMAKEQDLPLNPLKISGLCGRLMCCLRYEFDAYKDFKSRAPKRGAMIDTPRGDAKVADLNTPRELIRLRFGDGSDATIPLESMHCGKGGSCPCSVSAEVLDEATGAQAVVAVGATPDLTVGETPQAAPAEGTARRKRRRGGRSSGGAEGAAPKADRGQAPEKKRSGTNGAQGGQQPQGAKRVPRRNAGQGEAASAEKPAAETPADKSSGAGRRRRRRRPGGGGATPAS